MRCRTQTFGSQYSQRSDSRSTSSGASPCGKHVRPALRERKVDPFLPLGHRSGDVHGARHGLQDLGPQADVEADPRVEGPPVAPCPRRVALDRRHRIAHLPRGAQRRDQAAEPAGRGDVGHAADHRPREPAALVTWRNLDRQRGERVRLASRIEEVDCALHHLVNAVAQPFDGPVPAAGDRVAVRERDICLLVVEDELVVGEVVVEPRPVPAENVALLVVDRPDADDLLVGPLPEVGALGCSVELRAHAPAARRSAAWSSPAAGPGAPAPIGAPSSSITGMTSRTDEDVKASSAAASWSTGYVPSRTS